MQRANNQRKADQWSAVYNEYQKGAETEQAFMVQNGVRPLTVKTFRKWK